MALPEFISKNDSSQNLSLCREIQDTVKNDILFTRLFNLSENGLPLTQGQIDFAGFGAAGADILVKGVVSQTGGSATLTAAVFELPGGAPIFQKLYRASILNTRKIAHEFVADFIYRFTGNRGVSTSRIAFSNNATGFKEIYAIDYDGTHPIQLTHEKNIALLPRWSPDKAGILYTTYRNGNPDLAFYSFATGKAPTLSARPGLNTSASFSPDGKEIVVTLSFENAAHLYLLDPQGKILKRLTHSKSSNTSASFSADGQKIIFVSDRAGLPQIYMMNTDGSHPERLSDGGWCDAPVWSPLGDKIVYSRGNDKGHHDIILQNLTNGEKIQITSDSGKNENPTFSPDGRFIAFSSTRNGRSEIYIASLDGIVQKKLSEIPGSSRTPSWEP